MAADGWWSKGSTAPGVSEGQGGGWAQRALRRGYQGLVGGELCVEDWWWEGLGVEFGGWGQVGWRAQWVP